MSGQKSDMKNVSEMARGRNEQETKSGKKLGADRTIRNQMVQDN